MRDLTQLIERVEKATGPDREIDCLMHAEVLRRPGKTGQYAVVGPPTYDPKRFFFNPDPEIDWIGYDLLNNAPGYTSSLDAVVALVEREMPKCSWTASNYCGAFIHKSGRMWSETTKRGTLALLLAFLRAKQAQP